MTDITSITSQTWPWPKPPTQEAQIIALLSRIADALERLAAKGGVNDSDPLA